MNVKTSTIVWTHTDEVRDISLAGRISPIFPEKLTPEQRIPDELAELGEAATEARSQHHEAAQHLASIPQLKAAIKELQAKGYKVPDYPDSPTTTPRRTSRRATRRCSAAPSTRCCARATPTAAPPAPSSSTPARTRTRWAWSKDSKTHVAHMRAAISTAAKSDHRREARPTPASSWSARTARHRAEGEEPLRPARSSMPR
jgi:isocitrate dehydrogenase